MFDLLNCRLPLFRMSLLPASLPSLTWCDLMCFCVAAAFRVTVGCPSLCVVCPDGYETCPSHSIEINPDSEARYTNWVSDFLTNSI